MNISLNNNINNSSLLLDISETMKISLLSDIVNATVLLNINYTIFALKQFSISITNQTNIPNSNISAIRSLLINSISESEIKSIDFNLIINLINNINNQVSISDILLIVGIMGLVTYPSLKITDKLFLSLITNDLLSSFITDKNKLLEIYDSEYNIS